jgi:hypothetical protein
LRGSKLCTLSAMMTTPTWGLPMASASPTWRMTRRPPLAAWKTSPTCQTQRPMND